MEDEKRKLLVDSIADLIHNYAQEYWSLHVNRENQTQLNSKNDISDDEDFDDSDECFAFEELQSIYNQYKQHNNKIIKMLRELRSGKYDNIFKGADSSVINKSIQPTEKANKKQVTFIPDNYPLIKQPETKKDMLYIPDPQTTLNFPTVSNLPNILNNHSHPTSNETQSFTFTQNKNNTQSIIINTSQASNISLEPKINEETRKIEKPISKLNIQWSKNNQERPPVSIRNSIAHHDNISNNSNLNLGNELPQLQDSFSSSQLINRKTANQNIEKNEQPLSQPKRPLKFLDLYPPDTLRTYLPPHQNNEQQNNEQQNNEQQNNEQQNNEQQINEQQNNEQQNNEQQNNEHQNNEQQNNEQQNNEHQNNEHQNNEQQNNEQQNNEQQNNEHQNNEHQNSEQENNEHQNNGQQTSSNNSGIENHFPRSVFNNNDSNNITDQQSMNANLSHSELSKIHTSQSKEQEVTNGTGGFLSSSFTDDYISSSQQVSPLIFPRQTGMISPLKSPNISQSQNANSILRSIINSPLSNSPFLSPIITTPLKPPLQFQLPQLSDEHPRYLSSTTTESESSHSQITNDHSTSQKVRLESSQVNDFEKVLNEKKLNEKDESSSDLDETLLSQQLPPSGFVFDNYDSVSNHNRNVTIENNQTFNNSKYSNYDNHNNNYNNNNNISDDTGQIYYTVFDPITRLPITKKKNIK
ncbi:hypothetical protein TRFO_13621 [Tritrichomonas foetus]|uniref:Uncharacterized protein n=1 Tax=Tritrichomonas foetus TaxID=1144522 RepID=A0A1J4KXH9_9EUKA|nr:hypothetical protein TRFO_13621 [Tritrichomonas foetus]|eukprot:OHT15943.1 hypothetical protein TRFO_13621 [Tritrichomonas foetus]